MDNQPSPKMSLINHLITQRLAREEAIIRHMLGEWVSELEPTVARDGNLQIAGLTIEGLAIGDTVPIVVANPWHKPRLVWNPSPGSAEWTDDGYVGRISPPRPPLPASL